MQQSPSIESLKDRRNFIGGSDARVIMGQDEKALIRLWQEKRGEVGPEDLSTNLIVQLGLITEDEPLRQCGLLDRLFLDWPPQPDAGPASIFFNEFDASLHEGCPDFVSRVGPAAQGPVVCLKPFDCWDRHIRGRSQFLLRPTQERASRLNLPN